MKVHALSWYQFTSSMDYAGITDDNVEEKTKTAIIEITGEQDMKYVPFYFKKDHFNVLRLLFDDIEVDTDVQFLDGTGKGKLITMSLNQGKQIVQFIKENEHVNNFIVHCAAGVSRSGSVAKFIAEYFNIEDAQFELLNPYVSPKLGFLQTLRLAEDELNKELKINEVMTPNDPHRCENGTFPSIPFHP